MCRFLISWFLDPPLRGGQGPVKRSLLWDTEIRSSSLRHSGYNVENERVAATEPKSELESEERGEYWSPIYLLPFHLCDVVGSKSGIRSLGCGTTSSVMKLATVRGRDGEILYSGEVTGSASFGRQRHHTPTWSEGAWLLLGDLLYSLLLLTSGLHVRPIWWEVEQRDTPPLPRSLSDRRIGRCFGCVTSSPTPNPVSEAASQCQDGYTVAGVRESYTGQPCCTLAVGRTFRRMTQPFRGRVPMDRERRWVFSFTPEVRGPPAQESILDFLSVGSHLESPQTIVLLLRLVPVSFPLSCLQLSLCNHCIRPAPVWLYSPLAWGSTADESPVPGTGRQGSFPREDSPAEKHLGRYCIYSPQG